MQGRTLPTLDRMLGRSAAASDATRLTLVLGAVLIALVLLAVQAALGLVFDPRYRDFPFAPMTAAAIPLLFVGLLGGTAQSRAAGGRDRDRASR